MPEIINDTTIQLDDGSPECLERLGITKDTVIAECEKYFAIITDAEKTTEFHAQTQCAAMVTASTRYMCEKYGFEKGMSMIVQLLQALAG